VTCQPQCVVGVVGVCTAPAGVRLMSFGCTKDVDTPRHVVGSVQFTELMYLFASRTICLHLMATLGGCAGDLAAVHELLRL
jgi:hypothetical protein